MKLGIREEERLTEDEIARRKLGKYVPDGTIPDPRYRFYM